MKKIICVLLLLSLMFLYVKSADKGLVVLAKNNVENIVVLVDDNDEKLISISEEKLEQFLSKLELQNYNKFELEDRVIIEGYSNKIKDFIVIDNKKINVQISIFDGVSLIGSPVIKKSFRK